MANTSWTKSIKRSALALGCAVFGLSVGFTSQAQAQMSCAQVRSELANLHNGGGGGRTAQLQQSINQQSRELGRAQQAYQQFQCSFGAAPQCGSIVAAIGQMQSNLDQMERQLGRVGGPRNAGRIAELERVFATQCGPGQQRQQVARQPQQAPQGNSLLAAIFGTRAVPAERIVRPGDASRIVMPGQPQRRGFDRPGETIREPEFRVRGSTFRTMCVRTSDGFYWPISFSTTRDRFDEDRGLCSAMCPGEGTELFAYRNPGQQVEAMVNTLTGEPYTDQNYAFAYRESFDPDNRCTPSASVLEELRSSTSVALQQPNATPRVPQPTPRPDMASDPESRALADAGVSFSTLGQITRPDNDGDEMVRVVGPNYGYFAN